MIAVLRFRHNASAVRITRQSDPLQKIFPLKPGWRIIPLPMDRSLQASTLGAIRLLVLRLDRAYQSMARRVPLCLR